MPKSIQDIKKEYPYYANVPDLQLADRIYDRYYKEKDLDFIRKAREALDSGLTVMYDSWW